MNGKAAKTLRHIASKLSPGGSGYTIREGFTLRGMPFMTIRRTGTHVTYQRLKQFYNTVPRPERRKFLDGFLDHANADYATGTLGG